MGPALVVRRARHRELAGRQARASSALEAEAIDLEREAVRTTATAVWWSATSKTSQRRQHESDRVRAPPGRRHRARPLLWSEKRARHHGIDGTAVRAPPLERLHARASALGRPAASPASASALPGGPSSTCRPAPSRGRSTRCHRLRDGRPRGCHDGCGPMTWARWCAFVFGVLLGLVLIAVMPT
jgi:hypothetical protein